MAGAVFFGTVAQLRRDPEEWDRNASRFGSRIASRYAQNLAKSLTAYGVGAIIRDDPRHVRYASDPGVMSPQSGVAPRIGHVFLDWATVRRSTRTGDGHRLPNIALFAAATASGAVGNLWYPGRLTTRAEVAKRTASSLGTALGASLYSEFSPELGRLLGAIAGKLSGTQKPPQRKSGEP
jgi:hypothetical protein